MKHKHKWEYLAEVYNVVFEWCGICGAIQRTRKASVATK